MTRLRGIATQASFWLALLALMLGASAGWSQSGRYSLGAGAAVWALSIVGQLIAVVYLGACWGWRLLPLYAVAGWMPSGAGQYWTLLAILLILATVLQPGVRLVCAGRVARRTVGFCFGGAILMLVAGVMLGVLPFWCLVVLLVLPDMTRVALGGADQMVEKRQLTRLVILTIGQITMGFIIRGLIG